MPERIHCSSPDEALARTDLYMRIGLGGRERTATEIVQLLSQSGFAAAHCQPLRPEYTLSVTKGCGD